MKMFFFNKISLLIIVFNLYVIKSDMKFETILKNNLFNQSYEKSTRPSETVELEICLQFDQIIDLDEMNQQVLSSASITMKWIDSRLTWDPNNYNNKNYILVKAKNLWLPDIYVINSVEKDGFIPVSDFHQAQVKYNGSITIDLALNSLQFQK